MEVTRVSGYRRVPEPPARMIPFMISFPFRFIRLFRTIRPRAGRCAYVRYHYSIIPACCQFISEKKPLSHGLKFRIRILWSVFSRRIRIDALHRRPDRLQWGIRASLKELLRQPLFLLFSAEPLRSFRKAGSGTADLRVPQPAAPAESRLKARASPLTAFRFDPDVKARSAVVCIAGAVCVPIFSQSAKTADCAYCQSL